MVKKGTVKGRVHVRLPLLYNSQSLIFSYSIHLNAVCIHRYGTMFMVGPYVGLMAQTASEV